MARRSSKKEDAALGFLALIAIIVAAIYSLVEAIIKFFINYWIILISTLIIIIIILLIVDFIVLRIYNKEIDLLNDNLKAIRKNIDQDFLSLESDKEIENMFDNAIEHFPKELFIDPQIMGKYENKIFKKAWDEIHFKWELKSWKVERFEKLNVLFYNRYFKLFEIKRYQYLTLTNDFILRADWTSLSNYTDNYHYPYMNDYQMFYNIIKKRFSFSSEQSAELCIWKLLRKRAEIHYSNYWETNYYQYFESANSTSLSDLIDCYCDVPFINHLDKNTITIFAYYLVNKGINPDSTIFYGFTKQLTEIIKEELEKRKTEGFERKLLNERKSTSKLNRTYSITQVDLMNGVEFENFVALIFQHMGYNTMVTPTSGDQGIDVIAEKGNEKIGIQAKRHSNAISNKAIQEVKAGMAHYNCNKGIVVTSNIFTKSAIKLAESNNIILWDRQKLTEIINEVL